MATPSDLSRAIEPGSVPYGERDDLEEGLQAAVPAESQGPGSTASSAPTLPAPGSPLEALVGGNIPSSDLPVTDGLSVGAGRGAPQEDPMLSSKAARLRLIATQATSPLLRQSAQNMLRRMAGGEPV